MMSKAVCVMIAAITLLSAIVALMAFYAFFWKNPQIARRNSSKYYCSRELMCTDGLSEVKNIMCNAEFKFGRMCRNAEYVEITNEMKQRLLDGHNQKRSQVAQGKLDGVFQNITASRMATIIWDDELEMLALQNVAQCEMKHDKCRRTKRFVYAGQNLYSICSYPTFSSLNDVIDGAMQRWFDEYINVPTSHWIQSFSDGPQPKGVVGHFTQMIWGSSFAMGCAIVKSAPSSKCQYLACNYATGNMVKSPIFKTGRMCEECQRGMNTKYRGLCREDEDFTDDSILFNTKDRTESPLLAEWLQNGKKFADTNA